MLFPPRDVFLAGLGQQVVVLDLRQDKYLALGGQLAAAALQALRPAEEAARAAQPAGSRDLAEAREVLLQRGILTTRPPANDRPVSLAPTEQLFPAVQTGDVPAPWRLGEVAAVLVALGKAWLALRMLPLHRTVRWIEREPVGRPRRALPDLTGLLDQFFAARPWFWAKPICRLDAVALCLYLRRRGLAARLVFGVRIAPFKAHCWVQLGDRVLNEPLDTVRRFTPIMTV